MAENGQTKRAQTIEHVAALLWGYHFGVPSEGFAKEPLKATWLNDAASILDSMHLFAVDPDAIERARKAETSWYRREIAQEIGYAVLRQTGDIEP